MYSDNKKVKSNKVDSKEYIHLLKSAQSLANIGAYYAKEKGSSTAFTFLSDGVKETNQLDFATLDQQARSIASTLAMNFKAGERVLLLYLPGLEFMAAFLGCLYAKIVAVPAYIPQNRKKDWLKLSAIIQTADVSALLTTQSLHLTWKQNLDISELIIKYNIIATDLIVSTDVSFYFPQTIEKSEVAFLQFTSGSTGNPKGVMITHQALLNNQLMIAKAFDHHDGVVVASWLPIYHDMGLIGSLLQPFCLGGQAIFMPPVAFLQSPIQWLSMISTYKAHTSGGPNFAYELCVNRITEEQAKSLDLSCWKVAFNGSEPIRAETMNRFMEKFAPYNFREQAFFPCYGLAEATLFVSGGLTQQGFVQRQVSIASLEKNIVEYVLTDYAESKTVVSSGSVDAAIQILIIDPANLTICEAKTIGEIWLNSPSLAKGYFSNEVATNETFKNVVKTKENDFYLRTGDLGFYDEGQLFVTGRIKDIIIIRGRNLYPQDIEIAIQKLHPALRSGGGAAFSVEINHEERLVLVQEIERTQIKYLNLDLLIRIITKAIAEDFGTQVHEIVLIKQATLVKTSSGKIERRTCKAQYLAGQLNQLFPKANCAVSSKLDSNSELKNLMRNSVAKVLRLHPQDIDSSTSLLEYGLDSLGTIELHRDLELQFSKQIPLEQVLTGCSIDTLSASLAALPQKLRSSHATKTLATYASETGFTLNQKALWTLYQLDPKGTAYNVAFAMRFDESLDIHLLEQALETVLERHEALRATFSMIDEKCIQKFNKKRSPILTIWPCNFTQEHDFHETIVRIAKEPFDLTHGPVFRANLFNHQTENFSVLLLSAHHIVIDMWSLSQLIEEIALSYSGEDRVNQKRPRPYSDFVSFSNNSLHTCEFENSLNYWKKQLQSPLPILNLPIDFVRPPYQTFRGAHIDVSLEAKRVNKLKQLAKDQNCTSHTLLLAAYQTLLHRYTGATDICTGCPTSGRPDDSFKETVGYFVNPIVIRCRPKAELSFLELLKQVQESMTNGLKYANMPLQYLAEHLDIKRESSISPLFQTIFTVKRAHRLNHSAGFIAGHADAMAKMGKLYFRSYPLPSLGAQVDLSLSIVEVDETYAIRLEYNSDLFKEETIKRLSVHYGSLLDSILANPTRPLGRLNMITEDEQRLLGNWTTTLKDEAQGCLHTLFEDQVEIQPTSVAICAPEGQLTYAELNFRANQIAYKINKSSPKNSSPIAIIMDSVLHQIEGMLAILKAGHPFVCLDTAFPILRLNEILSKLVPTVILLDATSFQSHGAHLQEIKKLGCKLIIINDVLEEDKIEEVHNPKLDISESAEAYIVFTSGSTGTPKGIVQSHRSFVQFLKWQSQTFNIMQGVRVANWSSSIYDASYCEIFGALGFGATLCVTESAIRYNPVALMRWLEDEQISIFQTVPSFFNLIIQTIESEPTRKFFFENLTHIMLAGERVYSELIIAWQRLLGSHTIIWNLYGPTESVLATYYRIENIHSHQQLVPIGRAIEGRQILILDENGAICPIGIPGELFIRSPYLTKEYFQDAEQTSSSFQLNPLIHDPKDRVFRTRDAGRWLANGLLEFLGRLDGQVKIRGMRVETGEIEAHISLHEAIVEVAVKILRNDQDEPQLVAYLVTSKPLEAQAMRAFLKSRLPLFMIPDFFMHVSHLPRTATNKIDRKALPEPLWIRENELDRKQPLSGLEKEIANLWCDLLKISDFDSNANFFDLGGHSLQAVRFLNKVRLLFGLEISLKEFFKDPTLLAVVEMIRKSQLTEAGNCQLLLSILDYIEKLSDNEVSLALERSFSLGSLQPC